MSPAIDIQIASDRTQTIRASVQDVEFTLRAQRRSWWWRWCSSSSAGPRHGHPTIAMPLRSRHLRGDVLLGYSLNNLSLMALTIATGFVVDDAIVVTENIARYVEGGCARSRPRSAGRGRLASPSSR